MITEIEAERLRKMSESCCVDSVLYPDQILDFQKPYFSYSFGWID